MSGGQTSSLMKDVFFLCSCLLTINRKRKGICLLDHDFESSKYFECNQSSLSAERYYG